MSRRNLYFLVGMLAIVGIIALAIRVQKRPDTRLTEYHFGVAAPYSGQEGVAIYGNNIKKAVDLAVDEINSLGGVMGRSLVPHYEDTQLLPSVAIAAVEKLTSYHNVDVVIGPVGSSSTVAASKLADQKEIILISPASTSHEISGISKYVFRTIAPDNYEGEAMAEFALKRDFDSFGIAFVDNAGTRGPAMIFQQYVEERGAKVVAFEVVPQGSTDARTQMTKLVSKKPDAVYLLGYALELGIMIKQFREFSNDIPILSFQVMEEPKVREIAGTAAEGIIFTTPTIIEGYSEGQGRDFISTYRKKYGEGPGIFAANAYDAIGLLAMVINRVGFDVESIRQGITEVRNYAGASGTFDIHANGDSNQKPHFMVVQSGELIPFSPEDPNLQAD